MDALSRLLILNAAEGSIDKNCHLSHDWQLPHAAGDLAVIRWHTVTEGGAEVELPSGEIYTLRPGRVVILPQNSAHRLSQKGEALTFIVCGSLQLQPSARYFLTALPEALWLAPDADSTTFRWLQAAIALMQQESSADRPGSNLLCSQQGAALFALAVRDWLTHNASSEKNVLNLLLHPRLGTVIFQMLEQPSHPWTVEALAGRVHMSRASFAQLFREVSDSTPLAVLTTLRMQIAAQAVSRDSRSILLIAESVGYASESSFHKAFTRAFGCTPGEYRKRVQALGQPG